MSGQRRRLGRRRRHRRRRHVGGRHRRRRRHGRRSRLERRQHGLGARRRRNRRRALAHRDLRGPAIGAAAARAATGSGRRCKMPTRAREPPEQEADGHSLSDEGVRLARLGDRATCAATSARARARALHLRRAAVRPCPTRPILRSPWRPDAGEPSAASTGHKAHRRAASHVHHRASQRLEGARRHPFELKTPPHLAPAVELAPVPTPAQPKSRPSTLSPASEKTAIVISGLAAAPKLASARAASSSVNVLKVMASISSMNSSPLVGIWMPPKSVRCVQLQ